MTRRITLRPEAEAEITDSIHWYDLRSPGLGGEFLRAVQAALAKIERNPALYPIVHGEVRRAPVRKFPFSILYAIDDRGIVVVSCFHTHRDPNRWKSRVDPH
jgi:plasmid stabilization system protein ParE